MRLDEALRAIEENRNYIGVYDEIIYTLDKALEGKLAIPVDTEAEVVPPEVIRQVKELVGELRTEHLDRIKALETMEIASG